ncbi:MAG: anhydro-N-acetylmuramic acid kinase [Myxococcales bacterium]|jgi:anhydro-N-acetylmuramic acid kinase|nr:anhydro-N-acetylmuramic acid kinase [Myxococcales bacterium]
MSQSLLRLIGKQRKQVVGLMSGTSGDGLDCALVDLSGHGLSVEIHGVRSLTFPYDPLEKAFIQSLFQPGLDARALCQASFRLGERFAQGVLDFCAELAIDPRELDLIGSHGQTVWHQPPSACREGEVPSTLQIGEPAVIAARTGAVTVGDFRVADVALGGEGAPLVPYCDYLLFRRPGRRRALQNIGGIANVSVLAESADEVVAFDNGPGNMLIDALAPVVSRGLLDIDRDGELSARGQVLPEVLSALLDDEYLRRKPPKSTGRERYGLRFAEALLRRYAHHEPVDLLATVVAFTAHAISDSLREFQLDELIVSGGGAYNRTLIARLERLIAPVVLSRVDSQGIDVDNKEAVAFAVLAVQALHGEPANLPKVTGARRRAVLGKICLPPL